MRKIARTDANQTPQVKILADCGFTIFLLHQLGGGVPDTLVMGYSNKTNRIELLLVEWKTPGGTLTKEQQKWWGIIRLKYGDDVPVIVAQDAAEVLAWYGR